VRPTIPLTLRRHTVRLMLLVVITAALPFLACEITFGGGGTIGNLSLGLPFRAQPDILLCGPTSVLMWRLGDGLGNDTPEHLGDLMGCPWRTSGCSPEQIVAGVRAFTATGYDAYLDDYGGLGNPDTLLAQYMSRQITSLANGVPVIALVDFASHAVVVNGGNYSTAGDGLKRWDYVYIHDPLVGANRYYTGGAWLNSTVFQIISSGATAGWQSNFEDHGEIHVRGWGEWPPHGGDWPPEM
jgi:hypothetical protein